MESIQTYLKKAVDSDCSDLFIIAGKAVSVQKGGELTPLEARALTPEGASALLRELYRLANRPTERFLMEKDDDFSLAIPGLARFRVNAYRQRGSRAAVIRIVNFGIPDWRQMNIPQPVMDIAGMTHGLVLVTGPAGSGKSTTLACILDAINSTRSAHIITIEDPIEYLHRNKKGVVSQRELDVDTDSGLTALRASLRQSPQVILMEELRDPDTIQTVLSAAETGRLVISTLYTMGAASAIDRVTGSFPPAKQPQIRVQLAQTLQAVISQQLLPAADGGQVPAFEVMHVNGAVRAMIREGRTEQIDTVLQSLAMDGMTSMDEALLRLWKAGQITKETALCAAMNAEQLQRKSRLHVT
ncbi:MAG: PilT/PilU family type 4a pilus ATPase [Oscillospiraceae bacterium]|jgi:twitching motility protein PilT|nr:PilT/PilU family type 4a pilus ATPase [Oscillospiraceae bacterium]